MSQFRKGRKCIASPLMYAHFQEDRQTSRERLRLINQAREENLRATHRLSALYFKESALVIKTGVGVNPEEVGLVFVILSQQGCHGVRAYEIARRILCVKSGNNCRGDN